MKGYSPLSGIGTLVTHVGEGDNPDHAHVTPIYQTSTFGFPDVSTGVAIFRGQQEGYYYTRIGNPNSDQLAHKYAVLEALDQLRREPRADSRTRVAGKLFSSGMAAITAAVLARARAGETILAQHALYGNAFGFFNEIAPRMGLHVIWVVDATPGGWDSAFRAHPDAVLAYAETPVNPTMQIVDLGAVAEVAHQNAAWLLVDNTFATPYCQRPLSYGADVVVHSTTKYLSGHGTIVGGAVVSPHLDYIHEDVCRVLKLVGGAPSPFDAWLANLGLKTFELRMQRHCENAMAIAHYLSSHPKVKSVYYPGLEAHPGHPIACRQMDHFGGMLAFDLQGGFPAGEKLMNSVRLATLAVSLGNVDSLIQHPASMTHRSVPPDDRIKMGLTDGLVRFSAGIENIEDILDDLDQAFDQLPD